MTDLHCRACDHEIFEDKSELDNYLLTGRKEIDRSIYKTYFLKNIHLDCVDKILNNYFSIHNKKFDLYFIKCNFNITFDNYTTNLETNLVYNKECYKILTQLLFFIDCMKFEGHDLCNINQMTINTINDRCNMTYEYYTHKFLNPLEAKLNIIFAKNPKLLDNNNIKNLFIKKYSHISFNI